MKRAAMLQNTCLSTNLGNKRLFQTHQPAILLARRRPIADSSLNTYRDSRILAGRRARLTSNTLRDTSSHETETPNQPECRIYICVQAPAFHGLVYLYRLNTAGALIACHPSEYPAVYQMIRGGCQSPTMHMVAYMSDTLNMIIVGTCLPSPMPF